MPDNCSSCAYLQLSPGLSFSNTSFDPLFERCSISSKGVLILTAFSITNIIIMLPVSIIVLCLGFQQWRKLCSSSKGATTSHSDLFTYNMVGMVLIEVLGCGLYCVGGFCKITDIKTFLYDFFCIMWSMKMEFHMLTCVERYLAVVHPVTYHGLKNQDGVRIRKICNVCVWLQWVLLTGLIPVITASINVVILFCHLVLAFIVISFCSLTVLCALRRPGPGQVGADREQVDQSKQRAFHTIITIMGTLLLSLGGVLVCLTMYVSLLLNYMDSCVVIMSFVWFSLPSSLVLPLLYLHRAGKLPCSTHKNKSGFDERMSNQNTSKT